MQTCSESPLCTPHRFNSEDRVIAFICSRCVLRIVCTQGLGHRSDERRCQAAGRVLTTEPAALISAPGLRVHLDNSAYYPGGPLLLSWGCDWTTPRLLNRTRR